MASQQFSEDAVAAADKEMEERANRAKELLSRRYHGLKNQQVSMAPNYSHYSVGAEISLSTLTESSRTLACLSLLSDDARRSSYEYYSEKSINAKPN